MARRARAGTVSCASDAALEINNYEDKMYALHALLQTIPQPNLGTLKFLMEHLAR